MALGKQIKTLADLYDVAQRRRSVVCDELRRNNWGFRRPKPAAFILSMQARQVLFLIWQGLYEWIPAKNNKSPWEKKADGRKGRQKQNG